MMLNIHSSANYASRRNRRATLKAIVVALAAIRDAEWQALKNLPDNFKCTDSFEEGELAVEALDEVIDTLSDVY